MSVRLRKRRLPSGTIQYYLDIYRGSGSRRTEVVGSLPENTLDRKEFLKQAQAIRAKRQLQTQAEMFGVPSPFSPKENFVKYYEKFMEERRADETRAAYLVTLRSLKRHVGRDAITFAEMSSREFHDKYKRHLLNSVSARTAADYFTRLKTVLNQAVMEGLLPSNPASHIVIKSSPNLPIFLTLEEIRLLNATPSVNDNVKNAFLFSCYTGLRFSDICALTWEMIVDGYLEFRQKKTGQQERILLSPAAKSILGRQRKVVKGNRVKRPTQAEAVFFVPSSEGTNRDLREWAKAAGLKKAISFHKARHTFATLSLASGVDIYTTSKLLGHRSLSTTQIYAKVIDQKKDDAVRMLPEL